jgi:hypothetical protein
VVLHPRGSLGDYRRYPVFSLPWLKGRSLIFVPAAIGVALLQIAALGALLNDWGLAALAASVAVPVWVVVVSAGPCLATFVRHRGLPLKWERPAVVAAIAVGIGVSWEGQLMWNAFSDATILPHLRAIIGEAAALLAIKPPLLVTVIQLVLFFAQIFCLSGGLGLRTYFYEQKRWREAQRQREMESLRHQKNEADLRVAVLQAQVEPHFLFNTLACLHSLIRQDPARAEATVEALVDHLRATMPKLRAGIGQSYSTLVEQLEVCESYLKVMQVRMGSRLDYVRDVSTELLGHPFPPLMLISLVENAIKHGIEPRPSGGSICVCAAVEDRGASRQLAVSVVDDGVGLKPGLGGGVGLGNIRAQLAARFGAYGELHVRPRPAGGVSATIRVPCTEASP